MIYAGMNTGIQDAHNLAWKLASVVKGISPSSILCTYEKERRPVCFWCLHFVFFTMTFIRSCSDLNIPLTFQIAIFNTALGVQNFRAAMAVPTALGLDPTIANSGRLGSILTLIHIHHYA